MSEVIYVNLSPDGQHSAFTVEHDAAVEHYESTNGQPMDDAIHAVKYTRTNTSFMPSTLTAENGAKALLIGEFYEEEEIICVECDSEHDDNCEACNGHGAYIQKTPVSWTTIKAIYAMVVDHYKPKKNPSEAAG